MEVKVTPNGVKLGLKLLSARERFTAFKFIPPQDQGNPMRMGWIISMMAVREIDGVPVPAASKMEDIERLIDRLDDDGITVAQQFVVDSQKDVVEEAKN